MSKKVISFRLSAEELSSLDEACRRFGMNRSQAVSAGIGALLHGYVHEGGALIKRTTWLLDPLTESTDDKPRSK